MYDEEEPFNPFFIGEAANELDYKIPNTPSYPPPVSATWPEPKQHSNRSVSQGTLAKKESAKCSYTLKGGRSYVGEVALSKAINEEMTTSKKQVAKERHHGYDKSKTSLTLDKDRSEVFQRSRSRYKEGSAKLHGSQIISPAKRIIAGERKSYASRPGDNVSEGKLHSDKSISNSRTSKICKLTPSLKKLTDSIRRELAESAKLSRALAAKASELGKRLKANYN